MAAAFGDQPLLDRSVGPAVSPASEVFELLRRPAWHADALCKEHPEVSWFPGQGESVAEARAICTACPVRDPCRAAGERERFGIWGGMAERARRQARRR